MAREAVIVAYGRTPCGRARKGGLAATHPVDYAAQALKGTLAKVPALQPEMIDDVVVGCAMPINQLNMNTARLIVNRAQLPDSVTAQTINRFCSSSLQAIATAANGILAGQQDVVVAGGVECMTSCFAPYPEEYMNQWLKENYEGAYMSMGETAERVAEKYGITRERMEQMAVESNQKAAAARESGKLAPSIIPVQTKDAEGKDVTFSQDDGIRPGTNLADLATLKPCFRENGRVTAATSSQTTDAAAFVVLMSSDKAKELGIKPIAKFVRFEVAGCDSTLMGIGPIYAIPKVMAKAGLTIGDMDTIELNEAFAAQALACIDQLGLPYDKVNPYGGAMALGHPMGATGAFLTGKALDYLADNKGKYALVSMCIGGGMGAAAIFEYLG
ncbi:MAG: thiolase family protein [Lachnospiraceae bacterium]|jgi:acetyl-CoA acyltransferase|nr:thiolase family protein [Lachnospiraceae bacterium]